MNVAFHEHVLLDMYLDEFPKLEPIQRFMAIVLNGLSKNSFMTVEEKRDMIKWYKDYFQERIQILEEALEAEKRDTIIQESISIQATNKSEVAVSNNKN